MASYLKKTFLTSYYCSVAPAASYVAASSTAPIHYLGVVWGASWGYLALGEVPGALEALGIALVMAGSGAATAASLKNK